MDGSTDIPLCGSEPIHIPGSIQPHGLMLVAARHGLLVIQGAGEIERILGVADWQGAPLAALLGPERAARVIEYAEFEEQDAATPHVAFIGQLTARDGLLLDVSAFVAGLAGADPPSRELVVVELEPAPVETMAAAMLMNRMEQATSAFQRAQGMDALCRQAALAVRQLNGFDRVLIYRFEDDHSGRVLAEDRRPDLPSFLNHRFPASDIPPQARALYLRNLVRVIPDIHYTPAPLRPPAPGSPLDMTDSSLRSVSPTHLQYMFNMGMSASASFSIVKDGALWGLVACHNVTPRRIPYEIRVACRAVAAALSREVKSRDEAEGYRLRLRLRGFEDEMVRLLAREDTLEVALSRHLTDIQRAMHADGVAVLRGGELATGGVCPPEAAVRALADWVLSGGASEAISATERLDQVYAPAARFHEAASGLLSMVLAAEDPWLVLWFRAEEIEVLNWAGNPHKSTELGIDERLSPRSSFDAWQETVRGRARRWTMPELEAAGRLREALLEVRRNRQMASLNHRLSALLRSKDALLHEKECLIGEVNHRVQNSMQLVSSFLALQAREAGAAERAALEEAGRRMAAVSLVHRRLYRGDQIQTLNTARYVEELCEDTLAMLGAEWRSHVVVQAAPVIISTDRAVTLGLVLTELIINANKYAYGGAPGPLSITLLDEGVRLRLIVADQGQFVSAPRRGFGSRMMATLVQQLGGTLELLDNKPGLRAVLSAPVADGDPEAGSAGRAFGSGGYADAPA